MSGCFTQLCWSEGIKEKGSREIQPAKLKTSTIYLFTERVCWPCIRPSKERRCIFGRETRPNASNAGRKTHSQLSTETAGPSHRLPLPAVTREAESSKLCFPGERLCLWRGGRGARPGEGRGNDVTESQPCGGPASHRCTRRVTQSNSQLRDRPVRHHSLLVADGDAKALEGK